MVQEREFWTGVVSFLLVVFFVSERAGMSGRKGLLAQSSSEDWKIWLRKYMIGV
jgi:hypothetical protein